MKDEEEDIKEWEPHVLPGIAVKFKFIPSVCSGTENLFLYGHRNL